METANGRRSSQNPGGSVRSSGNRRLDRKRNLSPPDCNEKATSKDTKEMGESRTGTGSHGIIETSKPSETRERQQGKGHHPPIRNKTDNGNANAVEKLRIELRERGGKGIHERNLRRSQRKRRSNSGTNLRMALWTI